MSYFDHNATTPLAPAAREVWLHASDEAWANPSSPYRLAARVHRRLEEARVRVADRLGCAPEAIVFTSGATEANNAVLASAARALEPAAPVLIGATEHPSVLEPARALWGPRAQSVPVDEAGRLQSTALADALHGARSGIVAVMAANNETGVLSPLREIEELLRDFPGIWWLCDASQWIGRLPSSELPRRAFVVGCAHKFGGPKGVGFLRVPEGVSGFRAALGGGQEKGRRGGTENYPAIASMVAALEAAEDRPAGDWRERAAWRATFETAVTEALPAVRIHGGAAPRLWNTVSLRMPAHENTRWVARLDRRGFQVSTGSACATGSTAPSHVLAAMGCLPEEARRSIRVSSGWETTEQDWRALAAALREVAEELQHDQPPAGGTTRVVQA